MARKCICHITGEQGTTDTFVKIGRFYYKNQQVYDEAQKIKTARKNLIDYICNTFLGYDQGQPFPTFLPKKLAELNYYDDEVILETFKQSAPQIVYQLEHKNFPNDYNKIAYIIAIIKNNIAQVNKAYIRQEKIRAQEEKQIKDFTDPLLSTTGTPKKGKDLTAFLGDDEL